MIDQDIIPNSNTSKSQTLNAVERCQWLEIQQQQLPGDV